MEILYREVGKQDNYGNGIGVKYFAASGQDISIMTVSCGI
jgi:hypothetical protein